MAEEKEWVEKQEVKVKERRKVEAEFEQMPEKEETA